MLCQLGILDIGINFFEFLQEQPKAHWLQILKKIQQNLEGIGLEKTELYESVPINRDKPQSYLQSCSSEGLSVLFTGSACPFLTMVKGRERSLL